MEHLAIGWACSLNDVFVRFPYEKYSSLKKMFKKEQISLVKRVFKECVKLVIKDIVTNNVTFQLPTSGSIRGEIHMEAIRGSKFEELRKKGKFKDIDFLESVFTGFLMFLYSYTSKKNIFQNKVPIYISGEHKKILTTNTNLGKQYG